MFIRHQLLVFPLDILDYGMRLDSRGQEHVWTRDEYCGLWLRNVFGGYFPFSIASTVLVDTYYFRNYTECAMRGEVGGDQNRIFCAFPSHSAVGNRFQ